MKISLFAAWITGFVVVGVLIFVGVQQQQLARSQREILSRIDQLEARQARINSATSSGQQAAQAPARQELTLRIDNAATTGALTARVIAVEFSDFECPFCGRYVRETWPRIKRDYVDTGKVQYVFRHFPVARTHPDAVKAAEAGECARLQGKFWPMHDRLFASQRSLSASLLPAHARAAGLNVTAFEKCLDGQATAAVRADLDVGMRANIAGTPAFFFGVRQDDGSVRVTEQLMGAKPYATFQAILDKMLK